MNPQPNTLTETTVAEALAELEERYEEWCALTGADPGLVGTYEAFERQLPCD